MLSHKDPSFKSQMAAKWLEYVQTRDHSLRDQLVEIYLFLVRATARRVHSRLGGRVRLDDLESSGMLGLLNAVNTFDPRRGIAFETFSVHRIRGAMLDEVRAMDWIPRSVRLAERQLLDAQSALSHAFGRPATSAEIAEHLRLPLETVLKMDRESKSTQVISLSKMAASHSRRPDDPVCEVDLLTARPAADPADREFRDEFRRIFHHHLTRTEQLIIHLYYVESLTLNEVAQSIGLSEGRVSQIHARILFRLREIANVQPSRLAA